MSASGGGIIASNRFVPEWWRCRKWERQVRYIAAESQRLATCEESDLRSMAASCRSRVRLLHGGDDALIQTFSLSCEISARVHGLRPHPVQVLGALAMSQGRIAQMRTGEGKTLASLMTVGYFALQGQGCHVMTANEYLATRDAEFARPVLEWFGLTTATLTEDLTEVSRRDCYQADVTYGVESAFGFDFLKDRLAETERRDQQNGEPAKPLQRGHYCAIVDEADSILIDQAGVPLVISTQQPATDEEAELLHWSEQLSATLTAEREYALDARQRTVRLTNRGCRRLRLTPKPAQLCDTPWEQIYAQIERSLAARHFFHEKQEYLVVDCRVEILDPGTGRILPGRRWRDGLQQSIEIQSGLAPTDASETAARITLQSYLRRYRFLCGMTGTAEDARRELRRVYGLRIADIPTNQPCRLRRLPPRLFADAAQKRSAIIADVERLVAADRAILIGTSSIQETDRLVEEFTRLNIEVRALHAEHHREEAEIIRQAGAPGRVTVATNMAGRGTDIKLHGDVRAAGGLHVILAEMNSSRRSDQQLAGRAARQGDPGSFQAFVSLEDALLANLGNRRVGRLKRKAKWFAGRELPAAWIGWFETAQRLLESRQERERRRLQQREKSLQEIARPLGLDPYVELPFDG